MTRLLMENKWKVGKERLARIGSKYFRNSLTLGLFNKSKT